ncbi:MAG: hypothetical protein P1P90_04680 [Patescibacteria group bacterium]|nr:hypothetical protein [Patescibacteria group bacterium]
MCHAAKRLQELRDLTELLQRGEDQKFFDLLFPKPEEHESSTNRPAIEEILLSRKLRELLVNFARLADKELAGKASGIIYENSEVLRRLAESERQSFGGTATRRFLDLSNQAKLLKRLFNDMKQARLAPVKTLPPPAEEPKVEAA